MAITINGSSGITMPDEGIEAKDLGNGGIIQVASTTKSDSNAEVDCADGAWLTVSGLTVSLSLIHI